MKPQLIKFKLKKSLSLSIFFILIHGVSLICCLFVVISFWLKLLLVFIVICNFMLTMRDYVLKISQSAVLEFCYSGNNTWCLNRNIGISDYASLNFPVFVSPFLIILNFRIPNKLLKTTVLITKDSLVDSDDYRRLKILLKSKKCITKKN